MSQYDHLFDAGECVEEFPVLSNEFGGRFEHSGEVVVDDAVGFHQPCIDLFNVGGGHLAAPNGRLHLAPGTASDPQETSIISMVWQVYDAVRNSANDTSSFSSHLGCRLTLDQY